MAEVTPTHRLFNALRLLVLFALAPLLIGNLLGPSGAGSAATLGAMLAVGTASMNGPRAARLAMPLVALAAALGSWSKPGWTWVLVATGFAVFSGLATVRGFGVAAAQATLMAVIVPMIVDGGRLVVLTAFVILGGLYGLAMTRRLNGPPAALAPLPSRRMAVITAIGLGLAVSLACSIAVLTNWERAIWMPGAIVVLGIPTPGLTEKLMVQRVLGQIGACGIVLVLGLATSSAWFLNFAGLIAFVGYLMCLGDRGSKPIMFFSAAVMLPAAAATRPDVLIAQRLGFNFLGVGVLLVVLVVLRKLTDRFPPPSPVVAV
ncbi:MAG: hypothetical protein RLZZ623_1109 [Actinomycetota bacterium]|jgi:Fusaric acid resistance protein-like